jgi:hypothetical protein
MLNNDSLPLKQVDDLQVMFVAVITNKISISLENKRCNTLCDRVCDSVILAEKL